MQLSKAAESGPSKQQSRVTTLCQTGLIDTCLENVSFQETLPISYVANMKAYSDGSFCFTNSVFA